MFYIRKFKYPLFVEDITEIDPEITRYPTEFNTVMDAEKIAFSLANYNMKVLKSKYKDKDFIVETEFTDEEGAITCPIIKLCFKNKNKSHIIIKYQIMAN